MSKVQSFRRRKVNTTANLLMVLFCIVFSGAVARGASEETNDYTQVPVKVNVLKGVDVNDVNDADIRGIVREANKILEQAGIELRRDPNIAREVSDTGNEDGKVSLAENGGLKAS